MPGHHRYFTPRKFSLRLFGEGPLTELPPPGLVAAEEEGATNSSEPCGNRMRDLLARYRSGAFAPGLRYRFEHSFWRILSLRRVSLYRLPRKEAEATGSGGSFGVACACCCAGDCCDYR